MLDLRFAPNYVERGMKGMNLYLSFASNEYVNFDAEIVDEIRKIVLLNIHGDISTRFAYLLESAIEKIFKMGYFLIILNCSEAEGFGTIPSGIIMSAFRKAKLNGGNLVLFNNGNPEGLGNSSISQVKEVLGLAFLGYYTDLSEAILSFSS